MKNTRAAKDLAIISVTAFVVYTVGRIFRPFERLAAWSVKYNTLAEIDAALSVFVFLGFALAIFAWRRWHKLRHEVIEHQQAEKKLWESEAFYHDLVETSHDLVWRCDAKGRFTFLNRAWERTHSYQLEEMLGRPFVDFQSPEVAARDSQEFGRHLAGGSVIAYETTHLSKSGDEIYLAFNAIPLFDAAGRIVGTQGTAHDITARKQAELEIQRQNRELTLLNQVIASSASTQEPTTLLEAACRELALAFNAPRVTVALLNEQRTAAEMAAEYLAPGQPALMNQTIPIHDSSSFRYLLTQKSPLFAADAQNDPRLAPFRNLIHQRNTASLLLLPLVINDTVIGSLNLEMVEPHSFSAGEISLAWNVADEVATALSRLRLAQTHRRLITAIEQTADSVIITDVAGNIVYVNPAFERASGYSLAEVLGRNPRLLKSGQQDAAFYEAMWATLRAGQVWHGQLMNKKKDGTLYTEDATISPVRDENEVVIYYVAVKRDMTRELQLEEQYRQAQKLESVGRLAGGVAHDFNNILTAIMGHAGLALRIIPADHPAYSDIRGIQQSAERAANLTRQLLAFARRQMIEPRVINLNDLILNLDKLLRRLIREDIELVTLPAPDLGQVKADPGQLEQVLLNLVINARDAMPEGGKLTLETANVTLDRSYTRQRAEVIPGEYVLLAVSDTGIGMTEEVKEHIYEPFFTTKEVGQGTGLGLATCFGIVKQNGGHISFYSEPDHGTTFKVYLPRVEEAVQPLPRPVKPSALPPGIETILLVEDEPVLQELATRTLRGLGYTVLEAANGEEALQVVQDRGGQEIHLVLTDVVMPRLGGKALANRLKALYPEIKILFMSGYTDETMMHRGILPAQAAFLQKPFTPTTLALKVREVLDR